jgi:hypothetical protein
MFVRLCPDEVYGLASVTVLLTPTSNSRTMAAQSFMPKSTERRRVRPIRRIPVASRIDVTRAEFNRVIALLNERGEILNDLRHNQEVQFQRLAQLQAEVDLIRRALDKLRRGVA